jgi:hypothetical protein
LKFADERLERGQRESFWIAKVKRLWLAALGSQSEDAQGRSTVMRWIQHGAELEARRSWYRSLPPEAQRDLRVHRAPVSDATRAVWRDVIQILATGLPIHALWGEESPAEFVQREISKALVMGMPLVQTPVALAQIKQVLAVWARQRGKGPVKEKALGKWVLLSDLLKTLGFGRVPASTLQAQWKNRKKSSG